MPSKSHQSPPPLLDFDENFGSLLQFESNQIPYPFDTRIIVTTIMREKEAKLKNYLVLNPIYPDYDVLRKHRLLDNITSCFEFNGLDFMFGENLGVFESMLHEL